MLFPHFVWEQQQKFNLKQMVLSRLNELEDVPYTVGKVWKSSFQNNLNHIKKYIYSSSYDQKSNKRLNSPNLVFFSQSLCNGFGSTNKPLLNMNQINQGLLFIITNPLEVHLSPCLLKKSIESFFQLLS